MKIIDLYNHAPNITKALTKVGAIPAHWFVLQEQYRDLKKFGYSDVVRIHHCGSKQPYRARDLMETVIVVNKEDKQKIINELQGLINLLNN